MKFLGGFPIFLGGFQHFLGGGGGGLPDPGGFEPPKSVHGGGGYQPIYLGSFDIELAVE